MEARLDYRHLHRSTSKMRAEVTEILFVSEDHEPDFALLRIRNIDDVEPLKLAETPAVTGDPVGVIGYPAEDADRNEKELMDELFGGIYRVKRFAPGFVTELDDDRIVITSDYSSLGGNSGSPVCNLDTGEVVALHFAGRFKEANYAVIAEVIAAARRQVGMPTHAAVDLPPETPATPVDSLAGRNGYDPEFLGSGDKRVDLPRLGSWGVDVAPVEGTDDDVLRYTNFSTVQSVSRRLPIVTAVNIDGALTQRLRRQGSWQLDGRLKPEHQIGNELYRKNPLDRGHMVRRRDPGWGPDAQQAEIDTFHYTNCVPQHEDLNQKDWVGLEDYILESAETRAFRASIFTGPIFRTTDKRLIEQPDAEDVQIPEEFWKIAVIVNEETGALSATGYVLSHGPFIRSLVESAFVYGSYRTYQVQIAKIESETGLTFGNLARADPLGAELDSEAPFSRVAREVMGPESLVLAPAATA
jgi:endonuclease G